jgi:hypothetical protein
MSEIERDASVDAAWKVASRDEPPSALDAAIRAAARQAVEAPRRARDKHWWYPFAAAATVAVIAVGLLQVTPPEQVAPTLDAVQPMKQETTAVPAAVPVAPPQPASASSTLPTAPATPQSSAALPSPAPLKKDLRASNGARAAGAVAQDAQRESASADKLGSAKERALSESKPAQLQASPAAPMRQSEPFPAAPPPGAPLAAARRDSATMPSSEGAASPSGEAAAPSSAVPRPPYEPPAPRTEQARPRTQAMFTADAAKAKTAAPRSAEDWIRLIRELRNEGRIDQAAKELVAFRDAYGERADSLLPQDLREFETRASAPGAK